jgi:hypothetical protein
MGMREITPLFDHYRIVARSIWNTGFWAEKELQNWDSADQFEQIKSLLFKSLVVARVLGGHCCDLNSLPPSPPFLVVPRGHYPVPVMIEKPREGDRNHYWDDPVKELTSNEAELHFVDFFDWSQMNYIDFQYYRVRIQAFPRMPHLAGREALIEHLNGGVFVDLGDEPRNNE